VPETDDSQLRQLEDKNVALYSILAEAWVNTRMERDKTLVTLSAGGIGVIIAIITTVGTKTYWLLWLFILAFLCFGVCIAACIHIYQQNSKLIEAEMEDNVPKRPKLKPFDKISVGSFYAGAILLCLICWYTAWVGLQEKEVEKMAKTYETTILPRDRTSEKSLDGIGVLKPEIRPTPSPGQSQDQGQSGGSQGPGQSGQGDSSGGKK
jgi:uncharacterized membrane protein YgcG